EDGDAGDIAVRYATEIVRQPESRGLQLTLARASEQLLVDLVRHPQSARADRVPEALESPVRLARNLPFPIVAAAENVIGRAAHLGKTEILHHHELGDGEAVVHLHQIDRLARTRNPGFRVCAARGETRRQRVTSVP